jgi:hypothetical protein
MLAKLPPLTGAASAILDWYDLVIDFLINELTQAPADYNEAFMLDRTNLVRDFKSKYYFT